MLHNTTGWQACNRTGRDGLQAGENPVTSARADGLRRKIANGLAADDGVALHFVGRKLRRVVSSRSGAAAFRVRRAGNKAEEKRIIPEYLGGR